MKTKRISFLALILVLAFILTMSVILIATRDVSYAASHSVGFAIKEKSDVYFVETGNNKVQNTVTGNDGKIPHLPELYRTDSLDFRFDGWYISNTETLVTEDTVLDSDVTLVDRWTYIAFDSGNKVSTITINNPALSVGTKQGEYSGTVATANVDGITATSGKSFTIYKGLNKSGDPLEGEEEVEINKNYSVVTTVTLKDGFKFDDQLHITASNGLAAGEKYKGNFWTTGWSTDATQVEVIINFVNSGEYYFLQQPESRNLENYAEYHYYYLLNDEGSDPLQSVVLQYKDNSDQWAIFGPATNVVSPYVNKTHTFRLVAAYEHGTIYSEPWTITWSVIDATIDGINLGVTIPKAGANADYTISNSNCRFVLSDINDTTTKNGVSWTGSTSGALPVASATFNNAEDYTLSIKLTARDGYSFDVANMNALFNGNYVATATGTSSEITISYTFEKDAPLTHTVYFNESLHGTGTMAPVDVNDGAEYILPDCTYTPETNYEFAAWSISGDLYKPGDTIVVNSNEHVFAVWQATSTPASEGFTTQPTGGTTSAHSYFTVSFELDNAISYDNISVLEYDENAGTWSGMPIVRDLQQIIIDGKIRKVSFYAEDVCAKLLRLYAYNSSIAVAKSDTFTVSWTPSELTKEPQGITLTVGSTYTFTWDATFDARYRILEYDTEYSDWSAIAETTGKSYSVTSDTVKSVTYQVCADIPYTIASGQTNYVFDVVVSQSFIVSWVEPAPVEYMYSYYPGEAQGSPDSDYAEDGEQITLLACMFSAPDGKQFAGWAVGSISATPLKQPGDKITITAETYIYAIWEDIPAATYTVSFNANGGTGNMADVANVSGSYTLPANGFTAPVNKQFKGWALSSTGEVIATATINVTAATTLYAIWEDIPVDPSTIIDEDITEQQASAGYNTTAFADAKASGKTVELTIGTSKVSFDSAAVNAIGTAANVTFTMTTSNDVSDAGIEGAQLVINITLDGFTAGNATVVVPFTTAVPQGKVAKVYYVNGNTKTDMNAVFADGKVTFTIPHFSKYVVVFENAVQPQPVNPDQPEQPEQPEQPSVQPAKKGLNAGAIAGIVIAIVVVLVGAGVAVFFVLKNKKSAKPQTEEKAEDKEKTEG